MDFLQSLSATEWSIIGGTAIIIIVTHYIRTYRFWTRLGVKQLPFPLPFFGNALDLLMKKHHELEISRYKKMGRIYGLYEGSQPILMVGDPELVRKILVKDFSNFTNRRGIVEGVSPLLDNGVGNLHGERWKTLRSILSQTFSSGKMRKASPVIEECLQYLLENLKEASAKGKPVDCRDLFGAFTMDVIARWAFGTKLDTHKDPNNPFVVYSKQIFDRRLSVRAVLSFISPRLFKLFGLTFVKDDVNDFFIGLTKQLIAQRKSKNNTRVDFLQLLLKASEMAAKGVTEKESEEKEGSLESTFEVEKDSSQLKVEVPSLKHKALTEMEVLSQCFIFFGAGYETTATTLTFVAYYMALYPEIQDKLLEEVDKIYEKHGKVDYDILTEMPYLNAVVMEVLRLNSPLARLDRVAAEDYPLGDTGIVIPKGTIVGIPSYAMHHDPEFYPEPEKFNPDRFLPENKDKIIPYTYLPFGAGPRNCVALRFASMETKLCAAQVLRHVKFSRCAETKVPPRLLIGSNLLQPVGIKVKVELRSH